MTESEETDPTETTEATLPENVQAVQALIDALPTVDTVTAEDYDAVQDAYDAYDALTEEEKAQVHGAEVFEGLFNWFNSQIATVETTASGTCGDHLTWTLDEDGTLTISGTGDMEWFEDYYSAPWYAQYHQIIYKVVIEEGVTSIGKYAFYGITNMTSVSIPSSVTYFGLAAFQNCSSLKDISIPDSVTYLHSDVFNGCSSLTNITIPSSITCIPDNCFASCINLTDVVIPATVTEIDEYAFWSCSKLENISIPHGVTNIGSAAFYKCSSLTSIIIPESVTNIYRSAFYECNQLANVYFGGTKEQWKAITIGDRNAPLSQATIHYTQVSKYNITAQSDGMQDRRTKIKFVVNDGESEDTFTAGKIIQYPEGTKIQVVITDEEPTGALFQVTVNGKEVTDNTFTVTEDAEVKVECHYLYTWGKTVYYNFWKDATTQAQMGPTPTFFASIRNRPDYLWISDYLDDPVTGGGGVWNLEQTITYGLGVQIDNTYLKYDTVTIQYFPYDASTGKFTDTPIELGEEPTGAGSAFAARGYEEKEKVRISYVLDGTTLYLDREVILQDGRRGWDGDRIQVCVRAKWADITEAYLKNAAIEALTAEGGNYSDQSFTVEDIILPENWNSIGEKIDNKYYFQADFVFQENERYFGGKAEGGLGFDIELLTPISLANESNKGTVVMTDAQGTTVTDSAQAGQVTIQVTPKDGGYKVASVTVQNGEAEPVDVALTWNDTVATGTFEVENESPYTVTVTYDQRTVPAVTDPTVALNLYVGTNAYGDDYSARVEGLEENLLKAVLGTEDTDGYKAYVWLNVYGAWRDAWHDASDMGWKNPAFKGHYPKQLKDPLTIRVVRQASDGYTDAYWEGSVRLTDSRPAATIQCAEVSPVTVITDLNPVLEAVKITTTDSASYTYSMEGTMPTAENPETSVTVTITAAESKTSRGGTKTVTVTAKLAGYAVTWQNWDGSKLAENTVYYGQKPSYDTGITPEKESAGKVYEWTGWEVTAGSENLNTDGTITGPVTYTATFTEKDDLNGNGKDDAAERAKVSLSHTGPGTVALLETEHIKRSGDDVIFDSVEGNGNQLTIIVTPTPVVGDTSRKNVLKQVTVNGRDVTTSVLDGKFTVALTNGETYTIGVTFEELTLNLKDNATIAVNKYADADRVTGLKEKLVAAVIGPEAKANDYKAAVEGAYDLDNLSDEIALLSAKLLEESISVTITDKNGLTDTVTVKLADSRKILAITIGDACQQPDGSYQILIESEGEPADVMDRVKQAVTITANGTSVTVQDSYIACLPSYSWPQAGGEETFAITVRVNAQENAEYQNCPQAVLTLKCKDTTQLPITSVQVQGEYYYSKGQTLTAKVEVKAGDITLKDTDYTISGNQGANAGGYTLTVTGTGIYTGTLNQSWSIHPAEVTITMKDATKKVNEDDPVNQPVVTVDKGELDVAVLGLDVTRKDGETAGVYPYTVTYRTSGNYTVTNKVSASLTIEDDGKAGLHPITFDPDDPTGTIQPGARVEIDGKAYILDEDCAAWIDSTHAKVLQTFVYHTGEDAYHSYPTGMYVWYLSYQEDQGTYTAQRIPELDNYFQYQGTSIRVNFKSNGIRFNTSVSEADTNALIGGSLIKTEAMEGFRLTRAGTLFKWGTLTDTNLQNNGTTASSLVYGISGESGFRVLQKNGDQNLFTGMLTGLGTDRDILNKDLVSRPYAVLERDGEEISIYGGTIQRSIYYVAKQNEGWRVGTAYNDYIKSIIAAVEEGGTEA